MLKVFLKKKFLKMRECNLISQGVNGEPKRYIVTQGPLDDTIVDFWRMVWEQQIRVIFMLTDFAEGGIVSF